jgi:hypothetical protein
MEAGQALADLGALVDAQMRHRAGNRFMSPRCLRRVQVSSLGWSGSLCRSVLRHRVNRLPPAAQSSYSRGRESRGSRRIRAPTRSVSLGKFARLVVSERR